MINEDVILIAEDDPGHALLIQKNLRRSGIDNQIKVFNDGQEILDFLFCRGNYGPRTEKASYMLLLDIRMPKIDGVEVLRQIKQHYELKKMPVIILTTTEDPREVEKCHSLGCSLYMAKPIEYEKFAQAIKQLGWFLMAVSVPQINGKMH